MDGTVRMIVEAIHLSPIQAVIFISGGASQALGWLMSVPGASDTVLEVLIPYSRTSMNQLLGKVPLQYTNQQTAEEMATLAYNRALKLSRSGWAVAGVGFTGTLASARPKFGDHRFCLSTRTSGRLWTSSISLNKGMRSREEEDIISSRFFLKTMAPGGKGGRKPESEKGKATAIADTFKLSTTFISDLHESEVPAETEVQFDEEQELEQIIDGKICMKIYDFSSGKTATSERKIILSGSFNPLHAGHLRLLDIASSICEGLPCFEISAINADKPPLAVVEIKRRIEQFKEIGRTVIISNQPYFYKKAELFPGSAFVIGADTAVRLINPKYYGGDPRKMVDNLLGCKNSGCLFLVGGRTVDGVFMVLEDLVIPEELKEMFISVPQDKFRMDVSSTEIRENSGL